jgi:hypothetical protein
MRKIGLVPLFVLFTLFTSDYIFLTGQASAGCCMCGTCQWGCTCRGTTAACPKCAFPETRIARQVGQLFSQYFSETVNSNLLRKLATRQCQDKIVSRLTLLDEPDRAFAEHPFVVGG